MQLIVSLAVVLLWLVSVILCFRLGKRDWASKALLIIAHAALLAYLVIYERDVATLLVYFAYCAWLVVALRPPR